MGFVEVARVTGAFAIVGAAVLLTLDTAAVVRARVAFTGVGPVPQRAYQTEAVLQGQLLDTQCLQSDAVPATTTSDATAICMPRQRIAATWRGCWHSVPYTWPGSAPRRPTV